MSLESDLGSHLGFTSHERCDVISLGSIALLLDVESSVESTGKW